MPELGYSVTQSPQIYYEKEVSNLKQRLNKIYPRCLDWFCRINPAFWDFCSKVQLESLPRRIRINVISLRLKS